MSQNIQFQPKTKEEFMGAIDIYCNNKEEGIKQFGIMNDWDVRLIKDMSGAFKGRTDLNEPIDKWDVSRVENMDEMFYGCRSFTQELHTWDVSNVKSLNGMFRYSYGFF